MENIDSLGDRLREEIHKKHRSVRSFCKQNNIVPQQLQNYLTNNIIPGGAILKKMSEIGININYVLTGNTSSGVKYNSQLNDFPIITKISSGKSMVDYKKESEGSAIFDYPIKDNCFAIIAHGNSMSPTIEEGDLLLVDANIIPEPNDIVAARFNDGDQIIKRFNMIDEDTLSLNSDNKNYDSIIVNKKRIDLIAPVIMLSRNVKKK